jgi:hypothetical protein
VKIRLFVGRRSLIRSSLDGKVFDSYGGRIGDVVLVRPEIDHARVSLTANCPGYLFVVFLIALFSLGNEHKILSAEGVYNRPNIFPVLAAHNGVLLCLATGTKGQAKEEQ